MTCGKSNNSKSSVFFSSCGIVDEGMKECIHIKKLNANWNTNIVNINHLLNLQELEAVGHCGISDQSMKKCINIKKIYALQNPKIRKRD